MSLLLAVVGQIGADISAPPSGLYVYGPMGIILTWFMWRYESRNEGLRKDIRVLSHRIDGMSKALLVDVISRDTKGGAAKKFAEDMLSRMEIRKEGE